MTDYLSPAAPNVTGMQVQQEASGYEAAVEMNDDVSGHGSAL